MQVIKSARRAINAKYVETILVREVGPGRPRKELCFENTKGDVLLAVQLQSNTPAGSFYDQVCDALATGLSLNLYVDDNGDAVETFGEPPVIEGHID